MMISFSVKTNVREELIDITSEVNKAVKEFKVKDGVCYIYTPHTTAAITINENADPDVRSDMLKGLAHLGLESVRFNHSEGNSPAHIKSSLVGCSEFVILQGGSLKLGTWQGIYFCEFDGPRNRQVFIQVLE
ncbi:MAG: secondary thiamine-phosphate synthase enzyme YjbQ [Spirochaetota bacterium]